MIDLARKLWNLDARPTPALPLIVLWCFFRAMIGGRVGVRDKESFEQLRADGIQRTASLLLLRQMKI